MGNKMVSLKIPVETGQTEWEELAKKKLHLKEARISIIKKSLDARRKGNICWQMQLLVLSDEIKGEEYTPERDHSLEMLLTQYNKSGKAKNRRILVAGSGPAGLFSAMALNEAGYQVKWIEKGLAVEDRKKAIESFEMGGSFPEKGNYAVGEGGAGTFSDGKLTSRSKRISSEKEYILQKYLQAGAPEEITYLTHPHLGSDRLFDITRKMREDLKKKGVDVCFQTELEDLSISLSGRVNQVRINGKEEEFHAVILAPGHSQFACYRMLLKKGVPFRPKIFGLGFRAEHRQEWINQAQWGCVNLEGVKAAEYRLSSSGKGSHRVYSFCMCPGGTVVPAAPTADVNLVNGMSLYNRDGAFANAAVISSFHPAEYLGEECRPGSVLDWLEALERSFKFPEKGYRAPACSIKDFLQMKHSYELAESSYPLGLESAELWKMLPLPLITSLQEGLTEFTSKLQGYDRGMLMGLESKSSAPIQVIRSKKGNVEGMENFYLAGEGSGWAGGIISSAADGLRCIKALIE